MLLVSAARFSFISIHLYVRDTQAAGASSCCIPPHLSLDGGQNIRGNEACIQVCWRQRLMIDTANRKIHQRSIKDTSGIREGSNRDTAGIQQGCGPGIMSSSHAVDPATSKSPARHAGLKPGRGIIISRTEKLGKTRSYQM